MFPIAVNGGFAEGPERLIGLSGGLQDRLAVANKMPFLCCKRKNDLL